MNKTTIANIYHEVNKSFEVGGREVSKVDLRTVDNTFSILTILVKGRYDYTLVKLHLTDDGCYICNIANIDNRMLEISFICRKINDKLRDLGLYK